MRMCTEEERQTLISRIDRFIVDGKWTGAKHKNRGVITMRTKRARSEADNGLRKKHVRTGQEREDYPNITCPVSHLVLIKAGKYPVEDDEASHLCHNSSCIELDHLIWERGDFNRRRRFCVRAKKCVCQLTPPCLMHAHSNK